MSSAPLGHSQTIPTSSAITCIWFCNNARDVTAIYLHQNLFPRAWQIRIALQALRGGGLPHMGEADNVAADGSTVDVALTNPLPGYPVQISDDISKSTKLR